jgi:hypothetical protein
MDVTQGLLAPSRIYIGSDNKSLHTIDFNTGRHDVKSLSHATSSLSIGHRLISVGGDEGSISFVDMKSDKVVSTLKSHPSCVTSLAQKGDTLVSVGQVN